MLKVGLISDTAYHQRTGIGNYTAKLIAGFTAPSETTLDLVQIVRREDSAPSAGLKIIDSALFGRSVYSWYPYVARQAPADAIDVLHNPAQVPTYFRTRMPTVITIHDLVPLLFPAQSRRGRHSIYRALLPQTLKNASQIITVSANTKHDLMRLFRVSEGKITVTPLACMEHFQPTDSQGLDERVLGKYRIQDPFVLYVGTLEVRKNLPALIHAFNLACEHGFPHTLVLAGKGGWKTGKLEAAIRNSRFRHRIQQTGFVPDADLPGLYRSADVFVYPSLYEGFGLPPLESMACGTPVITSNSSSLPEVVGKAGLLVDPNDWDALGKSLITMLGDQGLRTELIEAGLSRAATFSWNRCIQVTREVYERAADSAKPSP